MQNPIINHYGEYEKYIYPSIQLNHFAVHENLTQRYKSTIPFQVPKWNHVARQCYLKEWLESTSSTERPPSILWAQLSLVYMLKKLKLNGSTKTYKTF